MVLEVSPMTKDNISTFCITGITDEAIVITDAQLVPKIPQNARTITEALTRAHGNKTILYRDAFDRWDEMCHNDGRFTGFAPYVGERPKL
jgi:hypothetical protein